MMFRVTAILNKNELSLIFSTCYGSNSYVIIFILYVFLSLSLESSWLFCLLWCRAGILRQANVPIFGAPNICPAALCITLLCTVPQSTVTKQHGCQRFGCGLKTRALAIGAAILSNQVKSVSYLKVVSCHSVFRNNFNDIKPTL